MQGAASAQCGELSAVDGSRPLLNTTAVNAFVAWDPDGPSGPAPNLMVVGGGFSEAGGLANVGGIVGWDEGGPVRLGAEFDTFFRPQTDVSLLATLDPDGIGPEPVLLWAVCDNSTRLAYFNGIQWRSVGIRGHVSAMTTWDPDGPTNFRRRRIVLGGGEIESNGTVNGWEVVSLVFESIGTNNEFYAEVAQANDPTPQFGGDPVRSLTAWDPDGPFGPQPESLVVGGRFDSADGVACSNIVMLVPDANPNVAPAYHTLAGGVNDAVTALGRFPLFNFTDQLIIGGDFSVNLAGGGTSRGMLIWDGAQYLAFGGDHFDVTQIVSWDPDGAGVGGRRLVVNGRHTGVSSASGVSAYDQLFNRFENVASDLVHGFTEPVLQPIPALGVWDSNGGGLAPQYLFAGGGPVSVVRVNQTDNWLGVPQPSPNGAVFAVQHAALGTLTTPPGNRLFIGGSFTQVGSTQASNIAVWNGDSWANVSNGLNGAVRAMFRTRTGFGISARDSLYVGGDFTGLTVGGVPLNHIASVTSSPLIEDTLNPLGAGVGGPVHAITLYDPDGAGAQPALIVAAGEFTTAGGAPANRIATWNRTSLTWSTLGSGFDGAVRSLAVWDPDRAAGPIPARLVAGGDFTMAGGLPIARLAFWDGVQWQAFAFGAPNASVRALAAWDRDPLLPVDLVIGGDFTALGAFPSSRIARYDNSVLDGPFGAGFDGAVHSIAFAELNQDQAAPPGLELVVGGAFNQAVGAPPGESGRIAFWEASTAGERWRALPVLLPPTTITPAPVVRALTPESLAVSERPALLVGGSFLHPTRTLDNLLVYAGTDPYIRTQPVVSIAGDACPGDDVTVTVEAVGDGLVYRWQKDGTDLFPGPTPSGSVLAGVDSPVLSITGVTAADQGDYGCRVANLCNTVATIPAGLLVDPCCSPADLDDNNIVDVFDLLAYLDLWFAGAPGADIDGAPGITVFDLLAYLDDWFAGC